MTTGFTSFRDPNNAAFWVDGRWYRIASPSSAAAMARLRNSDAYDELTSEGVLVRFDEVADAERNHVVAAFGCQATRPVEPETRVFCTETVSVISYPWEWPDPLLSRAAHLTLQLRDRLLSLGLDLKDASALNVQFRGSTPVFLDVGSIEEWRPNPSWNASRQFIEHFVNPLAVGAGGTVTSADAWELSRRRGLGSVGVRQLLAARERRRPSLRLLQATTLPREGNQPAETEFRKDADADRELALRSTRALSNRLRRSIDTLAGASHRSTWHDYGDRTHYTGDELDRKLLLARDFVAERVDPGGFVLDIGGNDGLTARHLAKEHDVSVIVLDPDPGALETLVAVQADDPDLSRRVTPLVGDVTNLSAASGLLGGEHRSFLDRVRPRVVVCQAVLHHMAITQGVPLPLAVDALAQFGAPVQIEFATEEDPKVELLLSQIPNWAGTYSLAAFLDALGRRYHNVEVVGRTSAHRVMVNADGGPR